MDSLGNFIEFRRYGPAVLLTSILLFAFGNRFSTSTVTISRSLFSSDRNVFDESSKFRIVEDYLAWTCLLSRSPRISHLPKYLSEYRVHASGISQASYRSLLNERHVLSYLSYSFSYSPFLQSVARCRLLIRSSRVRSTLRLLNISLRYPFQFLLLVVYSLTRRLIFYSYYLFCKS